MLAGRLLNFSNRGICIINLGKQLFSKVCLTLCCFVVYSTRRFVLCHTLCYFVIVFFSPFSIAITSLGEERTNRSAFCTFVRFALVWFCPFPLPLGVWEGLRYAIVALPGLSLTFSIVDTTNWSLNIIPG